MSTISAAQSIRVHSLDGGGIKGYTTLLILKRIFRKLKDDAGLPVEPLPCSLFDLIVGTSTGGLIAVMLGRLHMSIDDCLKLYEAVGERVFGDGPAKVGKILRGMVNSPIYDITLLQREIKAVLEERGIPLNQPFVEPEEDLKCRVMVCVTRTTTSESDCFRNYYTEDTTQENYDCNIWEAASATAAAPIYFKHVKIERSGKWCDGCLRKNNPINEALSEVGRLKAQIWNTKELGCVLSIGTGNPRIKGVPSNLFTFLRKSVEMMTNAEEVAESFASTELGRDLLHSRRYFRFSVPQGMETIEMDEWRKIKLMDGLTMKYLKASGTGREVEQCVKTLWRPDDNR